MTGEHAEPQQTPPEAPATPEAPALPATSATSATSPLLLVLVGDSPRQPSGLGRIARDLGELCAAHQTAWGVDFLQLGWEDLDADLGYCPNWPFSPFSQIGDDWGAGQVAAAIRRRQIEDGLTDQQVVLWLVWDPARCWSYAGLPWWRWAYTAVDGHNPWGGIGGPARDMLMRFDRVLAYTRYGAEVIKASTGLPRVPYLPHGTHWTPLRIAAWRAPTQSRYRLGCVAANQPRKDLGLWAATLTALRAENPAWTGWLHTDRLVTGAWSIPELLEAYQLPPVAVELTQDLGDAELIDHYSRCSVTLAVGRGEGFGYPILESLACGVPCLHVDYAGGAELLPPDWRLPYVHVDRTNPYVIGRPLVDPATVVAAIQALDRRWADQPQALTAYCQALAAPYAWQRLHARWRGWIEAGLAEARTGGLLRPRMPEGAR